MSFASLTDVHTTLRPSPLSYGTLPECPSFKPPPRQKPSVRIRRSLGLSPPLPGEVDWVSMSVIYLITFVSEAARGLLLPSAWPFFRSVGGSKAMLGVFVGMLSYGRMMTTIPLGYLSDSGSMAHVFYATCIVQIAGHVLYIHAPSVPGLIAARLVLGFGSSTVSVCHAYITRSVPDSERTLHFAYLSALQFGAFATLPAVGGLFSIFPPTKVFSVSLNEFTYPAAVLVFCNIVVFAAVYALFIDPPKKAVPSRTDVADIEEEAIDVPDEEETPTAADYLPMLTCALSNIVMRGTIATLETVATPFFMEQYGMTYESSGLYMTAFGIVGLGVFAGFKPIAHRVSDRFLVAFGLVAIFVAVLPLSIDIIGQHLPVGLYALFLGLIWGVGYPVGQTGALSLFSKTTQGLPVGGLFGIYSASASLARVLFAIIEGAIWGWFGRGAVFALLLLFAAAALVLVSVVWQRLGVINKHGM